jgi:hypothetical protein
LPSSTPKDWSNGVAGATAITATSLEDLEGRLMGPFTNVEWFGATGDGTTNDAPAIQAAIDSLTTGGTVYFPMPASSYTCTSQLTLPAKVSLVGEATEGCILRFPSGLTSGQYAIDVSAVAGTYIYNVISGLDIRGPAYGVALTPGTANTDINGVKLCRRMTLRNTQIRGFYRGVGVKEDHCYIDTCFVINNHFNLAWISSSGREGDQFVRATDLNACSGASIYVEDGCRLVDTEFIEVHLGNGPYGILTAPARVTTGFLQNVVFIGLVCENFGTAVIRGQNTTDTMIDCEFLNCTQLQSNTYKPAADTYNYVIECGSITRCTFEGIFPSSAPASAWIYGSASGSALSGVHIRKLPSSGGFSSATSGKPLIKSAGGTAQPGNTWSNSYGSGTFFYSNDALASGEVAKIAGTNAVAKYGTADTIAPAGVARHACGIGDHVALATSGDMGSATVNDGGVSVGSFLKPSTTTAGRLMATTAAGLNTVGINKAARTTGQTITAGEVRLCTWVA